MSTMSLTTMKIKPKRVHYLPIELKTLQDENKRQAEILEQYGELRDTLKKKMQEIQDQMVKNLERQFIIKDLEHE